MTAAFEAIRAHEQALGATLLSGIADLPSLRIWGIADQGRRGERVPTVSVTHQRQSPMAMAAALAERGFYVWPGNHYALPLTETLGLEPHGTLRIGIVHYNTADEVERLLAALAEIA